MQAPSKSTASPASNSAGPVVVSGLRQESRQLSGNGPCRAKNAMVAKGKNLLLRSSSRPSRDTNFSLKPRHYRLSGNLPWHSPDSTGFSSHFPTFFTLFRGNPAFLPTKLTFRREQKSFLLELKPFLLELKPFYFELKPFYFELKPFYFELKPFLLEQISFYLELKSFLCELKSFLLGQISFFHRQFRQKTSFFSGLLPEFRVMCAFACS